MNQSRIASIDSYTKYGIPRSEVLSTLQRILHIPASHQHTLQEYKLLYTSPDHFFSQVSGGMLTRHDKPYIVIYHQCNRYECIYHSGQLMLSYREAQPEYNLPAYVLVTPASFH